MWPTHFWFAASAVKLSTPELYVRKGDADEILDY